MVVGSRWEALGEALPSYILVIFDYISAERTVEAAVEGRRSKEPVFR